MDLLAFRLFRLFNLVTMSISNRPKILLTKTSDVKKLVHFFRTPTWIAPPHTQVMAASPAAPLLASIKMDSQGRFTESQIEEFKTDPVKYATFVKTVEAIVNSRFKSVRSNRAYSCHGNVLLTVVRFAAYQGDSRSRYGTKDNRSIYGPCPKSGSSPS